jgi:hypothetical protein
MAQQPSKTRASTSFDPKLLSGVLGDKDAATIITQMGPDHGEFPTAVSKLDSKLPQNVLQIAILVHSLSGSFDDLTSLVRPAGYPSVSLAVSTPSTSSIGKETAS